MTAAVSRSLSYIWFSPHAASLHLLHENMLCNSGVCICKTNSNMVRPYHIQFSDPKSGSDPKSDPLSQTLNLTQKDWASPIQSTILTERPRNTQLTRTYRPLYASVDAGIYKSQINGVLE